MCTKYSTKLNTTDINDLISELQNILTEPYHNTFCEALQITIQDYGSYTSVIFRHLTSIISDILIDTTWCDNNLQNNTDENNLFHSYCVINPIDEKEIPKKFSDIPCKTDRICKALNDIQGLSTQKELAKELGAKYYYLIRFFQESRGYESKIDKKFLKQLSLKTGQSIPYLLGFSDDSYCLDLHYKKYITSKQEETIALSNVVSFNKLQNNVNTVISFLSKAQNQEFVKALYIYTVYLDRKRQKQIYLILRSLMDFYPNKFDTEKGKSHS